MNIPIKNIKVTITRDDLFCYRIKNEEETIESFGQDYLDDYGVVIPESLYEEYRSAMIAYKNTQDKIYNIIKKNKG